MPNTFHNLLLLAFNTPAATENMKLLKNIIKQKKNWIDIE